MSTTDRCSACGRPLGMGALILDIDFKLCGECHKKLRRLQRRIKLELFEAIFERGEKPSVREIYEKYKKEFDELKIPEEMAKEMIMHMLMMITRTTLHFALLRNLIV